MRVSILGESVQSNRATFRRFDMHLSLPVLKTCEGTVFGMSVGGVAMLSFFASFYSGRGASVLPCYF